MKKLLAIFLLIFSFFTHPFIDQVHAQGGDCTSITVPATCSLSPLKCKWDGSTSTCSTRLTNVPGSVEGSGSFSSYTSSFNNILLGPDSNLTSINNIISIFLPIIMTLGGLVLFIMLIMGGFSMMTAASDPQKADAGKQKITAALLGFFTLFASYWIIQILEIVLGINILGS